MDKLKFGDELTKDIYGRPVHVGDCVDTISSWNKQTHIYRSIAVSLTNNGNLRILTLYRGYTIMDKRDSALSVGTSWNPIHTVMLSPNCGILQLYQTDINMYSHLEDDERLRMFKDILSKLKPKTLRGFNLLEPDNY